MKKVIYCVILSSMLISGNNIFFNAMDIGLDNDLKNTNYNKFKEVEDVNIKFRFNDFFNCIEKKLK